MMESLLKLPDHLVFDENLSNNWKKFQQKFTLFVTAMGEDKINEERKIALFLSSIGDEGLDLYNTFTLSQQEKKDLSKIIKKFDEYCNPRKNTVFQRFLFNSIVQKDGQSFDNFLSELKKAVKTCEYKEEDEMIRDRVVLGIKDKMTQERLLREDKLDLSKAMSFCRIVESSKVQAQMLQSETVNEVKIKRDNQKPCTYCGYTHKPGRCPAYGKTCAKCERRHHFAKMCNTDETSMEKEKRIEPVKEKEVNRKSREEMRDKKKKKKVNELSFESEESSSESDSEEFCVSSVWRLDSVEELDHDIWMKTMEVEDVQVKFKLDTGAQISVLPLDEYRKMKNPPNCQSSNMTLVAYGSKNYKIKPVGCAVLNCKLGNVNKKVSFAIVDVKNQVPLLGLGDCKMLNLVARIDNITVKFGSLKEVVENTKYKSVFEGLGKFPTKYKIQLVENACPIIQTMHRVPYSLHDKLKDKLKELETKGIKKYDEPTEWLHNLVIVKKKNGDLRICLDPKYLNQVIKREHFLIPTIDDISHLLNNKAYFTVLDMKDGYWQICLDKESSKLCAFATPFGRFIFRRLQFGVCSAPEIFQRKNYEVFGDIPGLGIYFDDLIITGATEDEHDRNLKLVLDKALKYGIKFNKKKIQFKQPKVKYMGQIFSREGTEPDASYVEAIVKMKTPTCKTELLRLLGMVKYLCKFIPNMSALTAPLRNLTKENVEWEWTESHVSAIEKLKYQLTHAPILSYFDFTKPVVIQTDASRDGIGACLLQDNHPVAYSSRSLSKSEVNYAQIEKEMLAVVFGIEKFNSFIYGHKDITICSDHKPLMSIIKKDLHKVPKRLQNMIMRIINYNVKINYMPGKELYVADTLSRAFLNENNANAKSEFNYAVHTFLAKLPIAPQKLEQFKKMTRVDLVINKVIDFCKNGWPESNKYLLPDIKKFWHLRDYLSEFDDLLLLGNKIVVPNSLRGDMFEQIHEGHLGIEKSKLRARQLLYWPNMNHDIVICKTIENL